MWGIHCHKGKAFRETESPQEHNEFHKEDSLGRQRLWGIKDVCRPGYALKITRDTRGISMKINQWKDPVGDKGNLQGKRVDQNKAEIPESNSTGEE